MEVKVHYLSTAFILFSSLILSFSGMVSPAMFTFVNECGYTVWPGIQTESKAAASQLSITGFALNSDSFNVSIPAPWSGRMWARTLCSHNSTTGNFTCLTGECGSGTVDCAGRGAAPPATLAEFTLNGAYGLDFYNVSLVDGYNLPMLVAPQGGRRGGGNCTIAGCLADWNMTCPIELKVVKSVERGDLGGDTGPRGHIGNDGDVGGDNGGDGDIGERFVACRSACDALGDPKYCCSADYGAPGACKPSPYSELFKNACPLAYSYAGDDSTITFTCVAAVDYVITFCPARSISEKSSGSGAGTSVPNGGDMMTPKPVHLSCTLLIMFLAAMLMLSRFN